MDVNNAPAFSILYNIDGLNCEGIDLVHPALVKFFPIQLNDDVVIVTEDEEWPSGNINISNSCGGGTVGLCILPLRLDCHRELTVAFDGHTFNKGCFKNISLRGYHKSRFI